MKKKKKKKKKKKEEKKNPKMFSDNSAILKGGFATLAMLCRHLRGCNTPRVGG
jgi:hypothetical protein